MFLSLLIFEILHKKKERLEDRSTGVNDTLVEG